MAYNEIILDESILDIDSWLPKDALDELVKLVIKKEIYDFKLAQNNPASYCKVAIGDEFYEINKKMNYSNNVYSDSIFQIGKGVEAA